MKKIYVKDVLSFAPCEEWTEERLQKYDPQNNGLTPLQICELPIEILDILWLLLRPEIIYVNDLHELACKFAERALIREKKAGREPSIASWDAIEAKRKWLRREITDSGLKENADAADAAAAAAAADAADAAADAAAYAAAAAAADAADDAADADARSVCQQWQLNHITGKLS